MHNVKLAIVAAATAIASSSAAFAVVSYSTVPVGDPGNAGDASTVLGGAAALTQTASYGSVAYPYRMGVREVSNAQYLEFLNAVDPNGTNSLSLHTPVTSASFTALQGITLDAAAPTGSKYKLKTGATMSINVNGSPTATTVNIDYANKPVVNVNWMSTHRFANWLTNGQGGPGTTEYGAYALNNVVVPGAVPARNSTPNYAMFVLPTVDEFHKAAYYDPTTGTYSDYATGSNTAPTNPQPTSISGVVNPSGTANYRKDNVLAVTQSTVSASAGVFQLLSDVGDYSNATSPYGTLDQTGNASELMFFAASQSASGMDTGFASMGGGYSSGIPSVAASLGGFAGAGPSRPQLGSSPAYLASPAVGFRLVFVPEPTSLALAGASAALVLRRRTSSRGRK